MGFQVGAALSTQYAYIFFDPQCPHRGALWEDVKGLQGSFKITWIPVDFMSNASTAQGAAILASIDPADTMDRPEKSLLTGQGGIFASAPIPDEMRTAIERNKKLWTSFGVRSVLFARGKNMVTGKLEVLNGIPNAQAMASQLGWKLN